MRNTTLFALLCIVATGLLAVLACHLALADGSGSAAVVLVDPTSNPIGAFDQVSAFLHSNVWLGVGVLAYFVLEVLAKVPALSKLDSGRVTLVIAGAIAVVGSALSAYLAGGSVQSALFAGVAAVLAYVHPKAAEVATKAKA
jgi:hypothetical protein